MNKFIPKILGFLLLLVISSHFGFAQTTKQDPNNQPKIRCATDEALARQYQTDPAYRAMVDQRERDYQAWKATNRNNLNDLYRTTLLTGPVTIPVVFHIVLPNPNVVSNADCEYVINRLNLDFSGLNPDSTNGVAFYSVRGHSLIRFCLARRDPSGNFTTGIERRVGTVGIAGGEPQPLKLFSSGGLNPWDHTRYYNIWVGGSSGGILGIAPAIGVGTAASDGVCVNVQSFAGPASGSCANPILQFNLARTAVHEVGHNFGLYHTFQGGCADGDNAQIGGAGAPLPASILGLPDQSPALSGATSGCPTGTAASGCASSPNPPGKQYQNYMDYTDDACYSMFTNTQAARMEWVLEFSRAGYLTSNGCQLPAGIPALDGAITSIINPGGIEVLPPPSCAVVTYTLPTCPGPIVPRVLVTNQGTTVLTSVTISVANGGPATTATYPLNNLAYGKSQVVVLGSTPTNLGANALVITITQVNGAADANATNNAQTANFTLNPPAALPRAADFVATTFPPAGFTNQTIAGTSTLASWLRHADGVGGANGSMKFDCWNMGSGNIRDFRSTPAGFAALPNTADSVIVSFDVAHRQYGTTNDRLTLLYSVDCGATWLPAGYDKLSNVLATETPSSFAQYTTPAIWRNERVALRNATIAAGGVIQFAFRGTSAFGNWIYVDNINISVPVNRDASITAVNRPNTAECLPNFTPQVVVRNNGVQTITSYQVSYQIGASPIVTSPLITTPIAPNGTATVNLANVTGLAAGGYSIVATVLNVSTAGGTGDQNTTNDALTKPFTVRAIAQAPVVEGFEGATFPSTGWSIFNPNNNNTWVRNTTSGGFGLSTRSMFIDNYNFNLVNQIDDLVTLPFNCAGADSIIVTFDLAHKNFAGFNDRLAVGISSDCGATFAATTYNKAGAVLATAGASTANYTAPLPTDWRTERVAIGGTALANGNAILAFRCINGYGNNIFIDNINISLVYRRDIQAVAAIKPNSVECTGSFTPSIQVRNSGLDVVNSFTASYSINGGAPVSTNVTGLTMASGTTQTFNLTPASGLPIGTHVITMYTSALVTSGGTGDQFVLNDTVRKTFNILGTQAAPLVQNFEGTMPPSNWGINNPDNGVTWTSASTGFNSAKSATVQNFTYTAAGTATRIDELITPGVTYSGVDSVYLSFDLAAITKQYPGATSLALDSLQVLVSKDCGVTFTSVFNKWGEDLQTVNDPNYSNTDAFTPNNPANWKNVKLNITAAAGTSTTGLTVFFRNKSNNDNNVYIDNVNLSTLTFPARLKQQGYLLYPSPSSGSFSVQHFLPPTDLRYIEIFDARGRLVFRKQFGNGGANSSEKVDITREAAGVYQVKMGYTNKVITERIIKTN